MLMKPENRARITTQVVPWVAGAAAEAVSVTHGTSAPRRARSDPRASGRADRTAASGARSRPTAVGDAGCREGPIRSPYIESFLGDRLRSRGDTVRIAATASRVFLGETRWRPRFRRPRLDPRVCAVAFLPPWTERGSNGAGRPKDEQGAISYTPQALVHFPHVLLTRKAVAKFEEVLAS